MAQMICAFGFTRTRKAASSVAFVPVVRGLRRRKQIGALSHPDTLVSFRSVTTGDPPLRVATRHREYSQAVFFFADAVLIRPFIAELAHAETAPL